MGIATYNRGTRAIAQQIIQDHRPVEFDLMERANALPRLADAPTPFGPLVLYFERGLWFLECPVTGFSWWYSGTFWSVLERWCVTVTGFDHGRWFLEPGLERTVDKLTLNRYKVTP